MRLHLLLLATAASLTTTGLAFATNITEFPDNGSEQLARGGAWVARASDPLAAFYNPAGLAGQDTRLVLNANLAFKHTCFTRVKAANDTTADGVAAGATYPQTCNDFGTFPNPQLGMTIKVTDRVGVGLAVLGTSGVANTSWPEFVDGKAAPQRYLLLKANALLLTPTIAVGVRATDWLRVGASFQWGLATAQFSSASDALNADNSPPDKNDVKALLLAKDYFIPGFTLGAIASPTPMLDLAGWFKWSAPADMSADVATYANYFRPAVATNGMDNKVVFGYTKEADCAGGSPAGICGPDKGSVKLVIPMEAKIGVRLHKPVAGADPHRRDPVSQDVWDAELDFTYANNSALDALQIRFPSNPDGSAIIPVNGTGGKLPGNADQIHNYKDVIGVRLGGDWNVLPDQLTVRAGVFGETDGQDPRYQNIDFMGAARFGMAVGGAYRLKFGKSAEKKSALEISLGFMHMFVATQSNGANDPKAQGLPALGGIECNPSSNNIPGQTLCTDGRTKFRTNWPVNLGTITNSLNVLNVGLAYRF